MEYTIFDVKDALDLFEKEHYSESLNLLLKVHEQSVSEMQESAFVICYIAICFDCLQDPLEAAFWINKSLSMDPYNTRYQHTANIIYDNVESLIQKEALNADYSEKVTNLFEFLKQNGRVKSNTQFVMIRFYLKHKNNKAAKNMLDNALERNPFDKDLIILRKKIAKDEGDTDCLERLLEFEKSNLIQMKEASGTNQ